MLEVGDVKVHKTQICWFAIKSLHWLHLRFSTGIESSKIRNFGQNCQSSILWKCPLFSSIELVPVLYYAFPGYLKIITFLPSASLLLLFGGISIAKVLSQSVHWINRFVLDLPDNRNLKKSMHYLLIFIYIHNGDLNQTFKDSKCFATHLSNVQRNR